MGSFIPKMGRFLSRPAASSFASQGRHDAQCSERQFAVGQDTEISILTDGRELFGEETGGICCRWTKHTVFIGSSLKDNLKNLTQDIERDKYPTQGKEISHTPVFWCHTSCPTQGRFQQRQVNWFLHHSYDDRDTTLPRSFHPSHLPASRPCHHQEQQVGAPSLVAAGEHDG